MSADAKRCYEIMMLLLSGFMDAVSASEFFILHLRNNCQEQMERDSSRKMK